MAQTQLHVKFRMKICDHKTLRMTMHTDEMKCLKKYTALCVQRKLASVKYT